MKVTCKQQDLAKGLSTVGHAVSTRSTLPILSHILLTTEGDAIRLSATNLEIGITCRVPATIEQEGTTTVPARIFSDFVSNLPTDRNVELVLQPNGQSLKVSGQRSQATIRGMDPGEFPAIPSADGSESAITLDCAALRSMITLTSFAAATDDARPVFTGVLALQDPHRAGPRAAPRGRSPHGRHAGPQSGALPGPRRQRGQARLQPARRPVPQL